MPNRSGPRSGTGTVGRAGRATGMSGRAAMTPPVSTSEPVGRPSGGRAAFGVGHADRAGQPTAQVLVSAGATAWVTSTAGPQGVTRVDPRRLRRRLRPCSRVPRGRSAAVSTRAMWSSDRRSVVSAARTTGCAFPCRISAARRMHSVVRRWRRAGGALRRPRTGRRGMDPVGPGHAGQRRPGAAAMAGTARDGEKRQRRLHPLRRYAVAAP